jgi:hypothetical protein
MYLQNDEATKQIEARRDEGWAERCATKLTFLPGKRRELLRRILVRPVRPDFTTIEEYTKLVTDYFAGMSTGDREKFWKRLFPKLAKHVERAWLDAGERPYQHGWGGKPFRSPNHVENTAETRALFTLAIMAHLRGLDEDATWCAANAQHLGYQSFDKDAMGWLLAAVLRNGGADAASVRDALAAVVNGETPGAMNRHVLIALLNSTEHGDWELVGRLLLAAQRQEGVRQSILEAVDACHPKAFEYMLGLIIENDLARFSATVRAFDVWLGLQWGAGHVKVVNEGISRLQRYFGDAGERAAALREGSPEDAYLALWAGAYVDAEVASDEAERLLSSEDAERRFVAHRIIQLINMPAKGLQVMSRILRTAEEKDPRIVAFILEYFVRVEFIRVSDELFNAVAALFEAAPAKQRETAPLVWPWEKHALDKRLVASALRCLAIGAPEKLIPFISSLDSSHCVQTIRRISGVLQIVQGRPASSTARKKLSPEARKLMVELACDGRQDVQGEAIAALEPHEVEPDEVAAYLANLHRTAAVFRQGAIRRLTKLPDGEALRVAAQLISDTNAKKRAAGIEIASALVEAQRSVKAARALIGNVSEDDATPAMRNVVARAMGKNSGAENPADCFGLVPEGSRATPVVPIGRGVRLQSLAARECLEQLAALFLKHGNEEIEVNDGELGARGKTHVLLSAAGWQFPVPGDEEDAVAIAPTRLPLAAVWLDWLKKRPDNTRDPDGLEFLRAWLWVEGRYEVPSFLPKEFRENNYLLRNGFERLLRWFVPLSQPIHPGRLLVQYVEDSLAPPPPLTVALEALKKALGNGPDDHSISRRFESLARVNHLMKRCLAKEDRVRLAALGILALDQLGADNLEGPAVEDFVAAYDAGLANDRDIIWLIMRPRGVGTSKGYFNANRWHYRMCRELTGRRPHKAIGERHALARAVAEARDSLVQTELTRGEGASPASAAASQIRHAGGTAVLFRLIEALDKDSLVRQAAWGELPRTHSLSRLISVTHPEADDTVEAFQEQFKASRLKPKRLMEIGIFAPQWAAHIEFALERPGLADAIWWIHAHTKSFDYWRDNDYREIWAAEVNERTELAAADLEAGAVDVPWFHRVIGALGTEPWNDLVKQAKFASNSGGHKRAELFASAMLGQTSVETLRAKIDAKRDQQAVRAFGLVPLPDDERARRVETLARYVRLQEFKRESRKFGSQRQASERTAAEIALQNLARTAGFRDPGRLQWAMEAEAVADLAQGPVTVMADDVTATLSLTEAGLPEFRVERAGKKLASIPAKYKDNVAFAELKSRVGDLRRQHGRIRLSLEEAMCRGDLFSPSELCEFLKHPMLRPMVKSLVFIADGALIGYPDHDAAVLRDHAGKLEPIGTTDTLRIAHAVELFALGDWTQWQRECLMAERVQPFKQIFREVYPKTATELDDCDMSRRYAGQQVSPRQALALLKQRNWVSSPEEGVRRVFHESNVVADLWFQEHFHTPAELEGLTIEGVGFFQRGEQRKRLLMTEVPDRAFSEAMRDLDLVVSVAHTGAVDPEASASTVELRAALLRETCQLLRLDNVKVEKHHAIIQGTLAQYSVHLGSATSKVLPGRVMIIVAVHSQYRGRVFLPFANDDPKTAEVLAKVLLLARDHEIKDVFLLEQIRG